MAIASRFVTAEEFEAMTDLPPGRYDLVRGEIIQMSPAGWKHGKVALRVGQLLGNFLEREQLGDAYGAETGFVLSVEPPIVLAPDAAFVRKDRLHLVQREEGFFPGYPDLAVEIISPSDRPTPVMTKVFEYLEAGTPLVWVVDPEDQTVMVFDHLGSGRKLVPGDTLDGGDVLPGFSVPVEHLFA